MSTLHCLPKRGPHGPQKDKHTHLVRRAARSNRHCPEFPISTLHLRKTLSLPHSGVKPGRSWLWLRANALVWFFGLPEGLALELLFVPLDHETRTNSHQPCS
jgi:hypothetical protein